MIPETLPEVLEWDHFREADDVDHYVPSPVYGGQMMQWRLVEHVALVVRYQGVSMGAHLWEPEVCVYWAQHPTYTSARYPNSPVMATVCGEGIYWAMDPGDPGDIEVEYREAVPGQSPVFHGRPMTVCSKCRKVYRACKGRPFWNEREG